MSCIKYGEGGRVTLGDVEISKYWELLIHYISFPRGNVKPMFSQVFAGFKNNFVDVKKFSKCVYLNCAVICKGFLMAF